MTTVTTPLHVEMQSLLGWMVCAVKEHNDGYRQTASEMAARSLEKLTARVTQETLKQFEAWLEEHRGAGGPATRAVVSIAASTTATDEHRKQAIIALARFVSGPWLNAHIYKHPSPLDTWAFDGARPNNRKPHTPTDQP